jgi:hypothetical protein
MPTTETLSKEIEAAVEQVVTEIDEGTSEQGAEETVSNATTEEITDVTEETKEATEATGETEVSGDEDREEIERPESTSSKSDDDAADEPSVPELSDEILARAIGAGMTLSDALSFPDEAALDRVVSAAERVVKPADQKGTAAEKEEDPFAELKLDPDKYEPEVVEMMDRVTKVLKNQHEQIQDFKQTQETFKQTQEETARAGQAQGLESPPREEVFNAAAGLVLRDEFQKAHEKKLAGDLEKRSSQHIQRAGGSKGATAKTPEEEVAQALNEKFGI